MPLLPTVAANVILSLIPDKPITVRSPDTHTVVSPMYNEEAGARKALTSLLDQSRPADQIVASVNGGTDDTYGEVVAALSARAFECAESKRLDEAEADVDSWRSAESPTHVDVIRYDQQTGKAASVNRAVELGLVTSHRVVVVDGDTVFSSTFLQQLADHTYHLRREEAGKSGAVLEEYGVISGGVMSYAPEGSPFSQKFISAGREAEYAFAYALRKGQATRIGSNQLTGSSRLYTLIGCGFSTRRDLLPMPSDTRTEDHDYTQMVQNLGQSTTMLGRDELSDRGFRFVIEGADRTPEEVFDRHDEIELIQSGQARFAGSAVMYTQDPPDFDGLVHQLDRWHGGGQQNFLKRLGKPLRANVAYTLWATVGENLVVLGLLGALLVGILLNLGNPSLGFPVEAVWVWLAFDVVSMMLLALYGFFLFRRAQGDGMAYSLVRSVYDTLRTFVPLTLIRYLNAVMYVVSAVRVVPSFIAQRWRARDASAIARREQQEEVTWTGPEAANAPAAKLLLIRGAIGFSLLAAATVYVAFWLNPIHVEGWMLTRAVDQRVEIEEHVQTPLGAPASAPDLEADVGDQGDADRPAAEAQGETVGDARADRLADAEGSSPTQPVGVQGARPSDDGIEGDSESTGHRVEFEPDESRSPIGSQGGPVDPIGKHVLVPVGSDVFLVDAARLQGEGRVDQTGQPTDGDRGSESPSADLGPSSYCAPLYTLNIPDAPRTFGGDADEYEELDPGALLTIARLVPLIGFVETAATAYALPVDFYIQVLVEESYLDPLAVGPTEDRGLSQMTSDALTLVREISTDSSSPYYNPALMARDFSVFDPDFSSCAGAAKLAWARSQVENGDRQKAYALFINPVQGVVRGRISSRHAPLTESMAGLGPMITEMANAFAAFERDPEDVARPERELLELASLVRDGRVTAADAYEQTLEMVTRFGIEDREIYVNVLSELYDRNVTAIATP